jgi:TonB-dependent SusC/RagA subfamily outer membrane receptor
MPSASDANVSVKGQPLYVIDGIPVGNQSFTNKNGIDFGNILSQLNPEDIDNITILKGGSAGALYGSEGGNGVVMITTKSGKGGKKGIGVSVSFNATMDSPYQFIEEQQLYGQGERAYEWQYDNTDTWGPKLDGKYSDNFWNTKTQKWDKGNMVSYNENRVEAYLQTGSTATTNVNVTGNYDKGSFRLSVTNMGNKGVMPNTKTAQNSITLSSEYKLTDNINPTIG